MPNIFQQVLQSGKPHDLNKYTPEDIIKLRSSINYAKYSEQHRKLLARALTNYSTTHSKDTLVTEVLSIAVSLELSLKTPSRTMIPILQRFAMYLDTFPNNNYEMLINGLNRVIPTAIKLSSPEIASFGAISSVIFKKSRFQVLLKLVRHNTKLCRLLVVLMSAAGELLPELNEIMECAVLGASEDEYLELEYAYCSLTHQRFLQKGINSTNELKYLLKALSSPNLEMSYFWCQKLSKNSIYAEAVLINFGFCDLAIDLGVNWIDYHSNMPLHEITASITQSATNAAKMVDELLRAWNALRRNGSFVDANRAIRTAYSRSKSVLGPQSVRSLAIGILCDQDGIEVPEPLSPVVSMFISLVKTKQSTNESFQSGFDNIWRIIRSDLTLNLLPECAVASFKLFDCKAKPIHKDLDNQLQKVFEMALNQNDDNWEARLFTQRAVQWLQVMSSTIYGKPLSVPFSFWPGAVQGLPLFANRAYHNKKEHPVPNIDHFNPPFNTVCLSLAFDSDEELWLTRYESDKAPVMVRLPCNRNMDYSKDSFKITYQEAVNTLKELISDSVDPKHASLAPRKFWELQQSYDNQLQKLVNQMEDSWFGGFSGLASAELVVTSVDPDLMKSLTQLFQSVISTSEYSKTKYNQSFQLSNLFVSLLQNASTSRYKVEDLVLALFDSLRLQGCSILLNELDIQQFVQQISRILAIFVPIKRPQTAPACRPTTEPSHDLKSVILICDRKAANIPWECFPVFRKQKVTRSTSIYQVREWMAEKPLNSSKVVYLVNPDNTLPPTYKPFVNEFKTRGWNGTDSQPLPEDQVLLQLKNSHSFVYLGHGNGDASLRAYSIRKLYKAPSAIYLFGCGSVNIHNEMLDDDAVTQHSVRGSSLIMGALWPVKDKDFNRFTKEFLSRVFDDKEPVGLALVNSRKASVLQFLTGGAPVVYGLPDLVYN